MFTVDWISMSKGHLSIYYYHQNNTLIGLMSIFFNGELLFWSGTSMFEVKVIWKFRKTFAFIKESQSVFHAFRRAGLSNYMGSD